MGFVDCVCAVSRSAIAVLILGLAGSPDAQAQVFQADGVKVDFITAYSAIWTDAGSGASASAAFWRPTPGPGWYRVGHHLNNGGFPTTATMVVKETEPNAVSHPTDYTQIWNDAGSGASRDGAVWRPVCRTGYSALGDVATADHGKPPLEEVVCVRSSSLVEALEGSPIWNDSGSGANRDFGSWGIQAPAPQAGHNIHSRGLFYGAASHARPGSSTVGVLWAIKQSATNDDLANAQLMSDALLFDYTHVFEKVWDDSGSGASADVGFFRPVPRDGYFVLGHYAHGSHAKPTDAVVMVVRTKPGQETALSAPLNYQRIWSDAGSGANGDVAVWWPSCPTNYVALGLITTTGAQPTADAVRCVRQDLTAPARVGTAVWNDSGSGANSNFGSWEVTTGGAPQGEAFVAPGTFIGHASHATPSVDRARALRMTLPVIPPSMELATPTLNGYGRPSELETQVTVSELFIPFTAITDPGWSQVRQARESPYYKMVRTDQYMLLDHLYNATEVNQSQTWGYSIAITNEASMSHTVGVEFSKEWGNEALGTKTTATMSYSFTYESSRSQQETNSIQVPIVAAPGKAVAAYAVHSTFQLFRADGTQVGGEAAANRPNSHVIVQYPLPPPTR